MNFRDVIFSRKAAPFRNTVPHPMSYFVLEIICRRGEVLTQISLKIGHHGPGHGHTIHEFTTSRKPFGELGNCSETTEMAASQAGRDVRHQLIR